MSKNKHMHSGTSTQVGPATCTAGPVSLVQGVYGARGNLELVACDAVDGLWVFWLNADLDDDPPATPDVPPGHWSAGLSFASGRRYVDAQILQSTLGPDHLEVLALTAEGELETWYWSPGPGFQRRKVDVAGRVARFVATHEQGTLRVTVSHRAGDVQHLVSTPREYPSRTWLPAESGPSLDVDAAQAVVATGVSAEDIVPGTARAATSTRHGGTVELTWRDADGGIRHLGVPHAPIS